jgi:outer membrane lipopolysaccharide assembly protein LptE/RlpB
MQRLIHVFLLIILILLVNGCTTHLTRTIDYTPSKKGVLSSISSKTTYIQVNDERPDNERDHYSNNSDGIVSVVFKSTEPPPIIIQNALKRELELNGHKVVSDSSVKRDISIIITLKRFYAFLGSVVKVAQIDTQISTHKGATISNQSEPWPVSGNFRKNYGASTGDCSEELNLALGDLIHNITFDSRFIEAFQQ